ncbi:MAG TPA: methyltransferase domain-containing protein [Candidatus Limnocylindrales bacterium]
MATNPCEPGCACAVGNEFGADSAERDLKAYRRDGPDRTTGWLLDGLRGGDDGSVDGLTVLDIGAGVGVVHLELLASGAASAVDVDGSPAYVAVARREADRAGVRGRVTYLTGDFVELAPSLAPADLVALDRVVCCYPDMQALVRLSAARALRRYGLVYPRDSWWIRAASGAFNGMNRLLRRRFRFHAHRTADVEATVAAAGLERVDLRRTLFWQVAVFERT